MAKRAALIHTVSTLVPAFKALCGELAPGLDVFNIVDESLLQNCIREGSLSPTTARRLAGYVVSAQDAGADAVLVTCSSVGAAVEQSRPFVRIPVLRVDEPMANEAVRRGRRVGVAATLRTTLEPTLALLRARAAAAGKDIELSSTVCEGAFEAVIAGDTARHDAIVGAALRTLCETSDVVVLAQASMARVADQLTGLSRDVPILSSPRLAVEHLAHVLS